MSLLKIGPMVLLSLTFLSLPSPVSPKSQDRFACEWIGVGVYCPDKFHADLPQSATFMIVRDLKGPHIGAGILPVKYVSASLPEKGSKWIFFVPYAVPKNGMFETFNGPAGRLKYSKKNLDMTLNEIEKSHLGDIDYNPADRQKLYHHIESWKL